MSVCTTVQTHTDLRRRVPRIGHGVSACEAASPIPPSVPLQHVCGEPLCPSPRVRHGTGPRETRLLKPRRGERHAGVEIPADPVLLWRIACAGRKSAAGDPACTTPCSCANSAAEDPAVRTEWGCAGHRCRRSPVPHRMGCADLRCPGCRHGAQHGLCETPLMGILLCPQRGAVRIFVTQDPGVPTAWDVPNPAAPVPLCPTAWAVRIFVTQDPGVHHAMGHNGNPHLTPGCAPRHEPVSKGAAGFLLCTTPCPRLDSRCQFPGVLHAMSQCRKGLLRFPAWSTAWDVPSSAAPVLLCSTP
jgi:hypothetical protein